MILRTWLENVCIINDHQLNRVLLEIVFLYEIEMRTRGRRTFIWPEHYFKSLVSLVPNIVCYFQTEIQCS